MKRNKWYDVRVAVRGRQCVCFLNGVEQSRNPGGSLSEGRVGLGAVKGTSVRFRDIKVTDEQGQPLWEGPPKLPGEPEPDAGGAASSIFNGKDLAGWKYLRGYWHVENGAIIGAPPPGANEPTCLFTEAAYKDFRLAFQIRLKGDRGISGAGFRSWMTDSTHCKLIGPQVKIGSAVSGQYPAGAVVLAPTDEGVIAADPTRAARAWKTNAFNAITVTCIGRHVTTTLNGTTIADGDVPASMPLPSEGYIGWQLGGKNAPEELTIKEIQFDELTKDGQTLPRQGQPTSDSADSSDAKPPARQAEAEPDGFVPLFNGQNLAGWKTHPSQPNGWGVTDGVLVSESGGPSYLYSEQDDFTDVHVRAEVRINDAGDSGIFVRASNRPAFPASRPNNPTGYEAQICTLDGGVRGTKTGGIYCIANNFSHVGAVKRVDEVLARGGEWFTFEQIVKGNEITVIINGRQVTRYVDDRWLCRMGCIALQRNNRNTKVEFRKIEVKRL